MTDLMRSLESWASHFVVSPIHSPAQQIHSGIVHRHIRLDGWMHLLMFQTTEDHSVPFYGFHINTSESCHDSTFVVLLCCLDREMHVSLLSTRNTNYFVFPYSCNAINDTPQTLFVSLKSHHSKEEMIPDLSPQENHDTLTSSLSYALSCHTMLLHFTTMQWPSLLSRLTEQ